MKKYQWIFVLAVALFVGGLAACSGGGASNNAPSPVGTWKVTVTPKEGPPFTTMITFHSDGTLVNMDPDGALGLGVWEKGANDTYAFTFQELIKDGDAYMQIKVNSTFTLSKDGEQYSGPSTVQIFDADGNLVVSDENPDAVGVRQHVEPMK